MPECYIAIDTAAFREKSNAINCTHVHAIRLYTYAVSNHTMTNLALITRSYSVVVIGSVGVVGSHLVLYLVKKNIFREFVVLSQSAASHTNRMDNVAYYAGDLTNYNKMGDTVRRLKPSVIIHSATPSIVKGTTKQYNDVDIQGTRNLLRTSEKDSEHVKALIYTSSSTLAPRASNT